MADGSNPTLNVGLGLHGPVMSIIDGMFEAQQKRFAAREAQSWIDAYVEAAEDTFDNGAREARKDIPVLEDMAAEIVAHVQRMRDLIGKLNFGAGEIDKDQWRCVADAWDGALNPAADRVLYALLMAAR